MKSLLNKDGIVANHIPNLNGLYGMYSKKFQKELYDMHYVFNLNDLENNFKEAEFKEFEVKYFTGFWPHVINWTVVDKKYENTLIEKFSRKSLILFYKILMKFKVNKFNGKYISSQIIMQGTCK